MMLEFRIHAQCRESARYHIRRWKIWRPLHSMTSHRTCVLVTALCNQPEAIASDLGDDKSSYLWINIPFDT